MPCLSWRECDNVYRDGCTRSNSKGPSWAVSTFSWYREKKKLDEVLSGLLKLAADIVKPIRVSSQVNVLVNDQWYGPYFKDCIGALDGTHVQVHSPSHNV